MLTQRDAEAIKNYPHCIYQLNYKLNVYAEPLQGMQLQYNRVFLQHSVSTVHGLFVFEMRELFNAVHVLTLKLSIARRTAQDDK